MNPFVSEHSITLLQQQLPAIQASPFDKTDAYRICVISAIICETGYRQLSWSPELAESLADIRNLLKFHDGSDTCSPWNRLIEDYLKNVPGISLKKAGNNAWSVPWFTRRYHRKQVGLWLEKIATLMRFRDINT
ncbi:hypothetical protein GL503_20080 [Salmonella enterica]|uniref:Uncharacterized protein n=1 Tax=Salmonella enterica I TaxID=59201 RepID=A0A403QIP5_SALET|nr:hypothetical protein [Salmonella enterica]EHL5833424.1 hypothetical protein [Salmonella enterica]EHX2188068.1 hypothetical protein [Salmonella enterica subsp. enterica serovar Kedougou]MML54645.1 hypothetical protein [Salmonella enterica subsp. enterica serovar Kidderminster]